MARVHQRTAMRVAATFLLLANQFYKAAAKPDFMLSGQPSSCKGIDIDGIWHFKGSTASQKPWYQKPSRISETGFYFMYFDPDVSGMGESYGQWVVGKNRPSVEATSNLAQDKHPLMLGMIGGSSVVAHTAESKYAYRSSDVSLGSVPPSLVEWDLVCWNGGDGAFAQPVRWRLGMSERF